MKKRAHAECAGAEKAIRHSFVTVMRITARSRIAPALKLGNTRNRIDTAEQFIDKVASSSSITGKPLYRWVKFPVKADENAQPYIYMRLLRKTDKHVE